MIIGVGTDFMKISQLNDNNINAGDAFTKKTFTENEIAEGMKREDRQVYFALRFCAKEAVFKSLGLPGDYIRMNEIEIRTTEIGQPSVCLNGEVKIKAADRGITQVLLSLSSDSGYVMAFAVAQGLPS